MSEIVRSRGFHLRLPFHISIRGRIARTDGYLSVDLYYIRFVPRKATDGEHRCSSCGRPRNRCRTAEQPFLSCCNACRANDGDTHFHVAADLPR
jgi:hypothetical protein